MKLKKEAMEARSWLESHTQQGGTREGKDGKTKKEKKKRGTERKKEPKGMTRYKKETRVVNVADDAGKMQE